MVNKWVGSFWKYAHNQSSCKTVQPKDCFYAPFKMSNGKYLICRRGVPKVVRSAPPPGQGSRRGTADWWPHSLPRSSERHPTLRFRAPSMRCWGPGPWWWSPGTGTRGQSSWGASTLCLPNLGNLGNLALWIQDSEHNVNAPICVNEICKNMQNTRENARGSRASRTETIDACDSNFSKKWTQPWTLPKQIGQQIGRL